MGPFSDHSLHPVQADCPNFWPGKQLPLGWVQYINPTDEFPEIRLRFTPAHGYVYGSSATAPVEKPINQDYVDVLYNSSEGHGTWASYADQSVATITIPGGIYAQYD